MWGINCWQTVSGNVVICSHKFQMKRKERYDTVINHFQVNIPEAETELLYDNPFQLLVAVILSAQCTDKRVNLTTPAIFEKLMKVPNCMNWDELCPTCEIFACATA